ncbi:hypothetical protein PsorP6_017727 [Peronosclerospora sorghi]|uniref:Uncharacterized protein n=1 Tax=Peronosclerospora sorghi TaxID=230839 RepID=A0ACC0WM82_9STRA|nr:hypothetical protein PsorP6_017727 [Peronosclerospora sorghi]
MLDFFGQFQFELEHRPGYQNIVADALSRESFSELKSIPVRDQQIFLGEKMEACTSHVQVEQGKHKYEEEK